MDQSPPEHVHRGRLTQRLGSLLRCRRVCAWASDQVCGQSDVAEYLRPTECPEEICRSEHDRRAERRRLRRFKKTGIFAASMSPPHSMTTASAGIVRQVSSALSNIRSCLCALTDRWWAAQSPRNRKPVQPRNPDSSRSRQTMRCRWPSARLRSYAPWQGTYVAVRDRQSSCRPQVRFQRSAKAVRHDL